MSKRASPALIGSFVVGGIVLAAAAIIVFGSGRLFHTTYEFVTYFDGTVAGLSAGAPVKFRGVEVGNVIEVRLSMPGINRAPDDYRLPVLYELDETRIIRQGGQISWDDPEVVDSFINIGLRAELSLESIVTGRKFIALDFLPGTPADTVLGSMHHAPQIPAYRRPGFGDLQSEVSDLISKLGDVKYAELIDRLSSAVEEISSTYSSPEMRSAIAALPQSLEYVNATVTSLNRLVAHLDSSIVPMQTQVVATTDEAAETLGEVNKTLAEVRAVLQPGSPLVYQLEMTLRELAAASRAMQSLTESIERNPSAFLRGKEARRNDQ